MKQAEVYLQQVAICPHCGHHNIDIAWADDTVDGKEEMACEHCNEHFLYAHPENKYGHAA